MFFYRLTCWIINSCYNKIKLNNFSLTRIVRIINILRTKERFLWQGRKQLHENIFYQLYMK